MRKSIIISILLIITATNLQAKAMIENYTIFDDKVPLKHTWIIKNGDLTRLICVAFPPSKDNLSSFAIYKKYKTKMKEIYRAETGGFPLSITESDGNLVTIWETATGYLIYVYSYDKGVVKILFDDGSNMLPEFVNLNTDMIQIILVPIMEWKQIQNTNKRERTPVYANVYVWNGKKYKLYENVPWKERFDFRRYKR